MPRLLYPLSTLALAATLAACSPLSDPPQYAEADVDQPDHVTCRTVAKTGTRLGTKVCRTNADWAQSSRDGREAMEQIQRQSTHTATPPGG